MARNIPELGSQYPGDVGANFLRVAKVSLYADTSAANDTTIDTAWDVIVAQQTDTPSAAQVYTLFEVPANCLVHDILFINADSWGASSDVVEITVGDTAAADGYLTDTILAPCTTATAVNNVSANSMTLSKGKLYTAAGQIEASVTFATTAAAATGRTIFWLIYSYPA